MATVPLNPSTEASDTNSINQNSWEPRNDHANAQSPRDNNHANGHTSPFAPPSSSGRVAESFTGSPASISIRAFLLGLTLGSSFLVTVHLALLAIPLWRLPFFLCSLSLFHYLEYQTTALYNPRVANVSAFLLSQNGWAYNVAHTCAFVESTIWWWCYPEMVMTHQTLRTLPVGLGFALMILGQGVRTTAMAQAGANFNHQLQHKRKEGHVLVTDGIYRFLRHPSYFGFFWWGLGSQLVLGNVVCSVGYAVVLWRFFSLRINREENLLIGFFAMDYVRYKEKTWVAIPFIS